MTFLCITCCVCLTLSFSNQLNNSSTNSNPALYKIAEVALLWDLINEGFMPSQSDHFTSLDTGLRSKYAAAKKYASLELIESAFDCPVFVRGPHNGELNFQSSTSFGYYNSEFIEKLSTAVKSAMQNQMYKKAIKSVYENHLKSMAHTYDRAYMHVNRDHNYLKDLQNNYLTSLALPGGTIDGSLQEVFRGYADNGDYADAADQAECKRKNPNPDWYESVTAPAFWLRRSIDGSGEELHNLLRIIIDNMEGAQ